MKTRRNRLMSLAALLLAGTMVFAACGGEKAPAAESTPAQEETATEATEEEPAAEEETAAAEEETAAEEEPAEDTRPIEEPTEATTFTYLIATAENSFYYDDYDDNPIMKYWLSKDWDVDGARKKIAIDFDTLPTGTESDTMNTLMGTGEYRDVITMAYSSSSAVELYEEGVALDLTEYVKKYMPNYQKWEKNLENIYGNRLQNYVDGEYRYLELYTLADKPTEPYCGYCYRRDWIVKYGKNPETGEAFTGGYTDDSCRTWEDDVVFPSGNTDPIYLSDWEWMLEIFTTALAEEGITDGYAMQIPGSGVIPMGDFVGGFGEGNNMYYLEDGKCYCGLTTEQTRTYLECMKAWYDKGWLQKDFDESADILFWTVDTERVYAGKVGAWYGMISSLGNQMAVDGICVYGAPSPINDVYGDLETCSSEPSMYHDRSGLSAVAVCITDKAKDKDIAALCTALDWFYSDEGGLMRSRGFSREQQAEIQDSFYQEWLPDGSYDVEERDGEEWYVINQDVMKADDLETARSGRRVIGLDVAKNVDLGYADWMNHGIDMWQYYDNTARVGSEITSQMTPDESQETSFNTTNIRTVYSIWYPDFITGRKDIESDADWQAYCDEINGNNPELYCDIVNRILSPDAQ